MGPILFFAGLLGVAAGLLQLVCALYTGNGGIALAFTTAGSGLIAAALGVGRASSARRAEWRPVLEAEVKRWESQRPSELRITLARPICYEVDGARNLQCEIQLIEDTPEYLHVSLSIDDGSLPASILPLSATFVRRLG